jgi:putative transcriptional regulator
MPERLSNRIKDRRAELGLTQAELAERVGVTRKTVNTVENGVFTPSATLAIKLAGALGLSVEQLFWIEGQRRSPRPDGSGFPALRACPKDAFPSRG